MTIEISSNYGFDRNWTLVVDNQRFYLGQDVKFCSRVLGMEPTYVAQQIGSGDLSNPVVNKKLAKFIVKSLSLDKKKLKTLQSWDLCAE